jgi:hypothetical protein
MIEYDRGKALEAWEQELLVLRAAGWVARVAGIEAPIQIEGRLPSGEAFFLHARHDEVCIYVGGADPIEDHEWVHCQSYGEDIEASYLPANVGRAMLEDALERWNARQASR